MRPHAAASAAKRKVRRASSFWKSAAARKKVRRVRPNLTKKVPNSVTTTQKMKLHVQKLEKKILILTTFLNWKILGQYPVKKNFKFFYRKVLIHPPATTTSAWQIDSDHFFRFFWTYIATVETPTWWKRRCWKIKKYVFLGKIEFLVSLVSTKRVKITVGSLRVSLRKLTWQFLTF